MSTAVYPLGMRNSMPASGYNHKSTYDCQQYVSWKGTGSLSNPAGIAPGHIRPLTNNDSGNVFKSGSFSSRTFPNTRVFVPRPIKHFRKGRVIPSQPITVTTPDPNNPNQYHEVELINYNMNRKVDSSKGQSLGGGFGGSGLLNDMMDRPGGFIVKENPKTEINESNQSNIDCKTCEGVGIVSSYYPNNTYVTENPIPQTENPVWCCNEEKKALRRVVYASTNLKQNYYTTHSQYLKNRCKTYDQKSFNFKQSTPNTLINTLLDAGVNTSEIGLKISEIEKSTPGSPLSLFNTYVGNCYPNAEIYDATEEALVAKLLNILLNQGLLTQTQVTEYEASENAYNFDYLFNFINTLPENIIPQALKQFDSFINNPYWGVPFAGPTNPNGCKLTVYKPNNYQYAQQGAVSSSTRMLKLNVDTISTNAASIQNYNNTGPLLVSANQLYRGDSTNQMNLLKNKTDNNCQNPPKRPYQNKKACYYVKDKKYGLILSQPSPYRYYGGQVFSTNHYSQSPNTYTTTIVKNSY